MGVRAIKSGSSAGHYFEKGADGEYYAKERGEKGEIRNSEWLGKLAEELGLKGNVKAHDLQLMLHGMLPNGESLKSQGGRQTENVQKLALGKSTDLPRGLKATEMLSDRGRVKCYLIEGGGERLGVIAKLSGGQDVLSDRSFKPFLQKGDDRLTCRINGNQIELRRPGQRRAGYDFVNSLPKSWDIAALQHKEIYAALREANSFAMQRLEKDIQTRVTTAGRTAKVTSANIAISSFTHFTSRPTKGGDFERPNGHIHNVLLNYTRVDGKTRAIEGKVILDNQRSYKSAFYGHLGQALERQGFPIRWEKDKSGVAYPEHRNITREQIMAFSPRRAGIVKEMELLGRTDQATSNKVARATRGQKTGKVADDLRPVWKAEAIRVGVDLTNLKSKGQEKDVMQKPDLDIKRSFQNAALKAMAEHYREFDPGWHNENKDHKTLALAADFKEKEVHILRDATVGMRSTMEASHVDGHPDRIAFKSGLSDGQKQFQLGAVEKLTDGKTATKLYDGNAKEAGYLVKDKDGRELGTVAKLPLYSPNKNMEITRQADFKPFAQYRETGKEIQLHGKTFAKGDEVPMGGGYTGTQLLDKRGKDQGQVIKHEGNVLGTAQRLQRDVVKTMRIEEAKTSLRDGVFGRTTAELKLDNGKTLTLKMGEQKNIGGGCKAVSMYGSDGKFAGTAVMKEGQFKSYTHNRLIKDPKEAALDRFKDKIEQKTNSKYFKTASGAMFKRSFLNRVTKGVLGKVERVGLGERLAVGAMKMAAETTKAVMKEAFKAAAGAIKVAVDKHRMGQLEKAGFTKEQAAVTVAKLRANGQDFREVKKALGERADDMRDAAKARSLSDYQKVEEKFDKMVEKGEISGEKLNQANSVLYGNSTREEKLDAMKQAMAGKDAQEHKLPDYVQKPSQQAERNDVPVSRNQGAQQSEHKTSDYVQKPVNDSVQEKEAVKTQDRDERKAESQNRTQQADKAPESGRQPKSERTTGKNLENDKQSERVPADSRIAGRRETQSDPFNCAANGAVVKKEKQVHAAQRVKESARETVRASRNTDSQKTVEKQQQQLQHSLSR